MEETKVPRCGHCGSTNVQGYTRVVGYFSIVNNWNKGKLAEFKDRQDGNYSIDAVKHKFKM